MATYKLVKKGTGKPTAKKIKLVKKATPRPNARKFKNYA